MDSSSWADGVLGTEAGKETGKGKSKKFILMASVFKVITE